MPIPIKYHYFLQGPSDIAIFLDPADKVQSPLSEEVLKEAQKVQNEILELLAQVRYIISGQKE